MPIHLKDIHSKYLNKIMIRVDKLPNLAHKNKLRQIVRDISAKVLNKDIRIPLSKKHSDLT